MTFTLAHLNHFVDSPNIIVELSSDFLLQQNIQHFDKSIRITKVSVPCTKSVDGHSRVEYRDIREDWVEHSDIVGAINNILASQPDGARVHVQMPPLDVFVETVLYPFMEIIISENGERFANYIINAQQTIDERTQIFGSVTTKVSYDSHKIRLGNIEFDLREGEVVADFSFDPKTLDPADFKRAIGYLKLIGFNPKLGTYRLTLSRHYTQRSVAFVNAVKRAMDAIGIRPAYDDESAG